MTERLDEQIKVTVEDAATSESIGNYTIIREIGRGGMGAVYEVEHTLLQQKYALKILSPDRIPDVGVVQRFRAEAKAISGLEHRGLLRMYEFGVSEKGQPFFVTDIFDGKPISHLLPDKKGLPTATVAQIMLQSASALAHAHERGVLHRDIKPSNILVKEDHGTVDVKIIDFGIAKQENTDGTAPTLTATGEIIGTPQYMSPEQCQGHKLDGRSDIYSLGCVLYEMLTGTSPFDGPNPMNIMFQHLNEGAKPVRFKDKVRQSLAAVAMRCLAKDRDKRYQSMEELIADLNAVAEGATLRVRRYDKRKGSFKERLPIYISAAVLAVVGALTAATYELWAPNMVLYMNLPPALQNMIMNPQQAEALVACKEADRLRNGCRLPNGEVDMDKLTQAESILRRPAVGNAPWNFEAASRLAAILALEGKFGSMDQVINGISGNDPLAIATNTHSVSIALDHGQFYKQAWPVMKLAHDRFQKLVGDKDPRTVKDAYNMATASYNSGERQRALAEFKAVLPYLQYWNPGLIPDCKGLIKELESTP